MLAEVLDLDVADGLHGRLREQNLPSVPCGTEAGDHVHVDADIVVVLDRRGPRVDPDPHAHRPVWPAVRVVALLDRNRGLDGVGGALECEQELVPARVDLVAVALGECLADQAAMVRDHADVGVAEVADEPGRALDVREDEGDCARRQLGHGPEFRGVVSYAAASRPYA